MERLIPWALAAAASLKDKDYAVYGPDRTEIVDFPVDNFHFGIESSRSCEFTRPVFSASRFHEAHLMKWTRRPRCQRTGRAWAWLSSSRRAGSDQQRPLFYFAVLHYYLLA